MSPRDRIEVKHYRRITRVADARTGRCKAGLAVLASAEEQTAAVLRWGNDIAELAGVPVHYMGKQLLHLGQEAPRQVWATPQLIPRQAATSSPALQMIAPGAQHRAGAGRRPFLRLLGAWFSRRGVWRGPRF